MKKTVLTKHERTRRLALSGIMLAVAATLVYISGLFGFLRLPAGGSFTILSMLPIVVVAYIYGLKWGLLTAFTFSIIEVALSMQSIARMFTVGDSRYQPLMIAVSILLLDYIIAYTIIGTAALARNIKNKAFALSVGAVLALSLRYLVHVVSGMLFFISWTHGIASTFTVMWASISYNGTYMIPEIIVTATGALWIANLRVIKKVDKNQLL